VGVPISSNPAKIKGQALEPKSAASGRSKDL
jgi:hypothetical protein